MVRVRTGLRALDRSEEVGGRRVMVGWWEGGGFQRGLLPREQGRHSRRRESGLQRRTLHGDYRCVRQIRAPRCPYSRVWAASHFKSVFHETLRVLRSTLITA
jgi:hypothetical protein